MLRNVIILCLGRLTIVGGSWLFLSQIVIHKYFEWEFIMMVYGDGKAIIKM